MPLSTGFGIGATISATIGATLRMGAKTFSAASGSPAQQQTSAQNVLPWSRSGMNGSGGAIWNAGNMPSSSGAVSMNSR